MKENHNDIPDMHKLAEKGWKQMHEMLREKGLIANPFSQPVSSKKRNWLIAAAVVFLILIISFPYIINHQDSFTSISKKSQIKSLEEKTATATENVNYLSGKQNKLLPVSSQQKQTILKKINAQFVQMQIDEEADNLQTQKPRLLQKFAFEKDFNISIPACDSFIDTAIKIEKIGSVTPPKKPKNTSRKTEIFAGAGLNVSLGNNNTQPFESEDLNIHPVATVIFPLSAKFSLHSGLSAFSTIHGKEIVSKEKELVNNFAGNVYYNIKTTSIVKASYFDVPVTIQYSFDKKWSAGCGLQFSKLYKVSIKEEKESFDYTNTLSSATVSQYNRSPMAVAAAFQRKVEIKKFETRFVAEANFRQNRFLFSAGYYYTPGKSIVVQDAANSSHEYRNEYFKLGIQYKIK